MPRPGIPLNQVVDEAAALLREAPGIEVSESKVRRWTTDRLLVPLPERPGRGQGKGRERRLYPAEAAEQAAAIARFLDEDYDLDRAALRLFGAGYDLSVDRVRDAFAAELDQMLTKIRGWLAAVGSEHADDPEAAKVLRSMDRARTVRAWRRRVGEKGGPGPILRSVVTNLFLALTEGETSSREGAHDMATALNLPAEANADDIELAAARAHLPGLKRLARRATAEELLWAAAAVRTLTDYGELARRFTAETESEIPIPLQLDMPLRSDDHLTIAWCALEFLAGVSKAQRANWDDDLVLFRADLPIMRARLAMVQDFEPDERCFFGTKSPIFLATTSEARREALFQKIRQWLADHPGEQALLAKYESQINTAESVT